jgi:hypothetical protein
MHPNIDDRITFKLQEMDENFRLPIGVNESNGDVIAGQELPLAAEIVSTPFSTVGIALTTLKGLKVDGKRL